MNPPPARLTTPRLVLRVPVPGDAPEIMRAYASDPDVTRYLLFRPDQPQAEVEGFLQSTVERWKQGSAFTWALTLPETGAIIGMIDARVDAYMVNVGYVLGRAYWHAGYATEALKAVIAWTDSEPEIQRVWAVCSVDNPASARVMEKAGMAREGILSRWMVFPNLDGMPRDCFCYSRVKS
jgi:[ribosomal protein S5]-alanine N-acetyltransferase